MTYEIKKKTHVESMLVIHAQLPLLPWNKTSIAEWRAWCTDTDGQRLRSSSLRDNYHLVFALLSSSGVGVIAIYLCRRSIVYNQSGVWYDASDAYTSITGFSWPASSTKPRRPWPTTHYLHHGFRFSLALGGLGGVSGLRMPPAPRTGTFSALGCDRLPSAVASSLCAKHILSSLHIVVARMPGTLHGGPCSVKFATNFFIKTRKTVSFKVSTSLAHRFERGQKVAP